MKKSTLLTVASVGAVALTSAMTFAAWDNLEVTATSTNSVTFNQINVAKSADITLSEPTKSDLKASYLPSTTGTVTFGITGIDASDLNDKQLKLTPVVKADGAKITDTSSYELIIHDGEDSSSTALTNNTDTTITGTNSYTVEVKAIDSDKSKAALANKAISVEITATLEATPGN